MKTFYLSGPMRGLPEHNYPAFHAAESDLAVWLVSHGPFYPGGWEIINPARNFDGDQTRAASEYMQVDMENVLRADVIVLLPGWEKSEGAGRETALAEWVGKEFWRAERNDWEVEGDGFLSFHALPGLPSAKLSPRADALTEAQALITGDRNNQYGPPTQDFQRAAGILHAMGYRAHEGRELVSHDVALMVMAVKMSRLVWTPGKRDSWVDIAGYAGCGFECAVEEAGNG